MTNSPNSSGFYSRTNPRLSGFNYAIGGSYFITICTHEKKCTLGCIKSGVAQLSEAGKIVEEEILKTTEMRIDCSIDEYVIMPNHIHMIMRLKRSLSKALSNASFVSGFKGNSVSSIISGIKSSATRRIRLLWNSRSAAVWQRNFYEHIIRNEDDYNSIRQYIRENPSKWNKDDYFTV